VRIGAHGRKIIGAVEAGSGDVEEVVEGLGEAGEVVAGEVEPVSKK
jgi:hypothetical protein